MVYLNSDSIGSNLVKFPKHFPVEVNKILFINEMTKSHHVFDVVDLSSNDYYYEFDLGNIELEKGTYVYAVGKERGYLQVCGENVSTEYKNIDNKVVYER